MTKENNCALCDKILEKRGKATAEYEVRQYGNKLRKICKSCLTGSPQPQETKEEKKK